MSKEGVLPFLNQKLSRGIKNAEFYADSNRWKRCQDLIQKVITKKLSKDDSYTYRQCYCIFFLKLCLGDGLLLLKWIWNQEKKFFSQPIYENLFRPTYIFVGTLELNGPKNGFNKRNAFDKCALCLNLGFTLLSPQHPPFSQKKVKISDPIGWLSR